MYAFRVTIKQQVEEFNTVAQAVGLSDAYNENLPSLIKVDQTKLLEDKTDSQIQVKLIQIDKHIPFRILEGEYSTI